MYAEAFTLPFWSQVSNNNLSKPMLTLHQAHQQWARKAAAVEVLLCPPLNGDEADFGTNARNHINLLFQGDDFAPSYGELQKCLILDAAGVGCCAQATGVGPRAACPARLPTLELRVWPSFRAAPVSRYVSDIPAVVLCLYCQNTSAQSRARRCRPIFSCCLWVYISPVVIWGPQQEW